MFVLGFHFPADMGNIIPDELVVEKIADVDVSVTLKRSNF
jgi:hypothetical protein